MPEVQWSHKFTLVRLSCLPCFSCTHSWTESFTFIFKANANKMSIKRKKKGERET